MLTRNSGRESTPRKSDASSAHREDEVGGVAEGGLVGGALLGSEVPARVALPKLSRDRGVSSGTVHAVPSGLPSALVPRPVPTAHPSASISR